MEGGLYCFVSLGICNFMNLDVSLLSEGSWTKINGFCLFDFYVSEEILKVWVCLVKV